MVIWYRRVPMRLKGKCFWTVVRAALCYRSQSVWQSKMQEEEVSGQDERTLAQVVWSCDEKT